MYVLGSSQLKSIKTVLHPKNEDVFEVIDTSDGVLERYSWSDCQKYSSMLKNLMGMQYTAEDGLSAQLHLFDDALMGRLCCVGTTVYFDKEELFCLRWKGQKLYVTANNEAKAVVTVAVSNMSFVDGVSMCRIEKVQDYYRVWFYLSVVQEYSEPDWDNDELVLDILINDEGKFRYNGVFAWNCSVQAAISDPKYRTGTNLKRYIQALDEKRM